MNGRPLSTGCVATSRGPVGAGGNRVEDVSGGRNSARTFPARRPRVAHDTHLRTLALHRAERPYKRRRRLRITSTATSPTVIAGAGIANKLPL